MRREVEVELRVKLAWRLLHHHQVALDDTVMQLGQWHLPHISLGCSWSSGQYPPPHEGDHWVLARLKRHTLQFSICSLATPVATDFKRDTTTLDSKDKPC